MNENVNKSALFNGSCFALITTAFTFSIRAGILPQLGETFGLSAEQLGFINSMWFLGFPISMIIGGLVYYSFGPKNIMMVAFMCHTIGIVTTIYAGGYTTLLISTLFIGIGNGCTEAACNPMIADMYSGVKMNKMLNRFHMWFPGGIVLGSLISQFMGKDGLGLGWQAQMWVTMVPTIIYAILFFGKTFPKPKVQGSTSIAENLKAMATPTFIFLFVAMSLTAITEFGPQQWVGMIMAKSGAKPMLVLALVTGLMAVGRFFAGPVIQTLGQTGVLLMGAIFAAIGIYLFSTVTGPLAYLAAVLFAIGVCYFWPVMVGAVAQRVPLSGALGMSIIGGVGMFSTAIWQPIIGGWIDKDKAAVISTLNDGDKAFIVDQVRVSDTLKISGDKTIIISPSDQSGKITAINNLDDKEKSIVVDQLAKAEENEKKKNPDYKPAGISSDSILLPAGQNTLSKMVAFPGILIVLFLIFFFWQKKSKLTPESSVAAH